MQAKSIKGQSPEEIHQALHESLSDGFEPTLAIVFLSITQDRKAITEILDKKGIKVFGVTSNGEFTDETPQKQSTAILLLAMKSASFQILHATYNSANYQQVAAS